MKELRVLCNLYIDVEDDTSTEDAVDNLYRMMPDDVCMYIIDSEIQEICI